MNKNYFIQNEENMEQLMKNFELGQNKELLQVIIDTIPNPVFFKDVHGKYRYCNLAFVEFIGLKKEAIIGYTAYDICPKEYADVYYDLDKKLMDQKGKQFYEGRAMHADGSPHDILYNKAAVLDKKGELMGLVGVMIDITERKKLESKISRMMKLKDALLEVSHAIVEINNVNEIFNLILKKITIIMDKADYTSVLALDNDGLLRICASTGYDEAKAKEFCVRLENSFIWHKTGGKIEKPVIINDIDTILNSCPSISENISKGIIQSSLSTPIFIEGKLFGLLNVDSSKNNAFDETDLDAMTYMKNQIQMMLIKHKLYEETIYLSRYDKLTNIYNRRHFEELIELELNRAQRYNEEFLLAVFDLNGLKAVNDTYGHLAGDKLIQFFATNLSCSVRASDIIARFGGDEFIGIFIKMDKKDLADKLEELRKFFIDNPIDFEGNSIICSFSYGIACFPDDGRSYNELVIIGDKNMYEYKQKIKNGM